MPDHYRPGCCLTCAFMVTRADVERCFHPMNRIISLVLGDSRIPATEAWETCPEWAKDTARVHELRVLGPQD